MNTRLFLSMCLALTMLLSGCRLFDQSNQSLSGISTELDKIFHGDLSDSRAGSAGTSGKEVANPPARTIRFDGHEVVLGTADATTLEVDAFVTLISPLLQQQKMRSAATIVLQNPDVSARFLSERWASSAEDPLVRLVASVLTQRSSHPQNGSWNSLLTLAGEKPNLARSYLRQRNAFAETLLTTEPAAETADQLQDAAQALDHPLVLVDCLRLLALRELLSDRSAWAESLYRQAIGIAENAHEDLLAADLWLMVAATASRSGRLPQANEAWTQALSQHMAASGANLPLDTGFWLRAEQLRPAKSAWPKQIQTALAKHAESVGCTASGAVEMVLWTSVANALFDEGAAQLALINFKKAETFAEGEDVMWLRIAQSKCLAALGQSPAAAAILSGPAASANEGISAAATAAMGSAKLQSGAYQQGAQLLNKALNESPGLDWATKSKATADLALAQLIIGDTDQGLEALHAAQTQFVQQSDSQSLLQSLENEARILEHEERSEEAASVRQRIARIERS